MTNPGALAAALACFAFAASAAAQQPAPESTAVALHWSAPAECPTRDAVMDDARTLAANRGAGSSPRPPVTVDALVERRAPDAWKLTLSVGAAQRHVEASSCVQLARAAALFVALIMAPSPDDASNDAPAATNDAKAPPPIAPPKTPDAAVAKAEVEPRASSSGRAIAVLAAAGFALDVGTLPRAELLGVLEVGMRYRRFEVTLQGAAGLAQEKTVQGSAGARLRPMSAMLTPCFAALVRGPLRLGACARGELGWIHAEGLGLTDTRSTDSAWVSLGGELAAWWALGSHIEARADAGALAPVLRPDFQLTGIGSVFAPGVAFRGGVAAVLRF